jgi:hypothetical protein
MIGRRRVIQTLAGFLLAAIAVCCGETVPVEFRSLDGFSARLGPSAARRFLVIVAAKPREVHDSPDGPSSKPLGYFVARSTRYYWEGNAIYSVTGSTRRIWIDPAFTRMYVVLRNRNFEYWQDMFEELASPAGLNFYSLPFLLSLILSCRGQGPAARGRIRVHIGVEASKVEDRGEASRRFLRPIPSIHGSSAQGWKLRRGYGTLPDSLDSVVS